MQLDGSVYEVQIAPYSEALVRRLGGTISARDPRGVYRSYFVSELKKTPEEAAGSARQNAAKLQQKKRVKK
ncbi:hypothetical protein [Actinosynnema sp. NPDC020468]|uniref:hypothetical protein n=1 Tax=Actinosynnema sp. NPDC020468 TaxID=3154488 RepID=UPI0033EE8CFD